MTGAAIVDCSSFRLVYKKGNAAYQYFMKQNRNTLTIKKKRGTNIQKENIQNKNIQNRNIQNKSVQKKNRHPGKSHHGQKLYAFVMLSCLSLFLYAFLVVKGYWPQQDSWQGNSWGNFFGSGQSSDQNNGQSSDQSNGTESEENRLEVHFIDVGQGDATLIKCGGETLLIDAAEEDKGTALRYYLKKQGVEKLNYLVLTHPDSDHIGSADVILTKFPVENVIMSYYEKESTSYRNLKDTLEYQRIESQIAEFGQSFEVGSARCTVLGPVQEYEEVNNASLILLVEHGANRFLFTGDAESKAEMELLAYEGSVVAGGMESTEDVEKRILQECLQADVYKAGHHGSSTSSTENFLDAVNPSYAVISCAAGNEYGHPHEEVLERFEERNIQIYRTDEQGTIVAVSDENTITWEMR